MEQSIPVIAFVDNETNRPRRSEQEDDRIDERNVIREQKKTSGRKLLAPNRRNAINEPREAEAEEVKRAFGERGLRHDL